MANLRNRGCAPVWVTLALAAAAMFGVPHHEQPVVMKLQPPHKVATH